MIIIGWNSLIMHNIISQYDILIGKRRKEDTENLTLIINCDLSTCCLQYISHPTPCGVSIPV